MRRRSDDAFTFIALIVVLFVIGTIAIVSHKNANEECAALARGRVWRTDERLHCWTQRPDKSGWDRQFPEEK